MKEKALKVVKLHHLVYLESVLTMASRLSYTESFDCNNKSVLRLQALLYHAVDEINHMIEGNFGEVKQHS